MVRCAARPPREPSTSTRPPSRAPSSAGQNTPFGGSQPVVVAPSCGAVHPACTPSPVGVSERVVGVSLGRVSRTPLLHVVVSSHPDQVCEQAGSEVGLLIRATRPSSPHESRRWPVRDHPHFRPKAGVCPLSWLHGRTPNIARPPIVGRPPKPVSCKSLQLF